MEKLGGLAAAEGHDEEALAHHREALAIRERLAGAEPGRLEYQRDLAVSYQKLGDLAASAGCAEEAREWYAKDLAIADWLARQAPDRVEYQTDLVASLIRRRQPGDLERALRILTGLADSGKLGLEHRTWLAVVERMLAEQVGGRG